RIDHLLLPRLLEVDQQLVALYGAHGPVTELLVEDPFALAPVAARLRVRRGHQPSVALDQRMPRRPRRRAPRRGEGLRPLPPGRGIAAAEGRHFVPARLGLLHPGGDAVISGVAL